MYYQISETLRHLSSVENIQNCFFAAVLTPEKWNEQKEALGFPAYAGSEPSGAHICKAEVYSKYIFGCIVVPNKKQILKKPYRLLYYLNKGGIVFVDQTETAEKIIGSMVPKYDNQPVTPEFFLYSFLTEFINEDIELLENYENKLLFLEENALKGNIHDLMPKLLKIRRELTRLRYYYEQMEDMARELEGDEQNYFQTSKREYIHLLGDRAGRLAGMAQQAIEYCHTLRDIYQVEFDRQQDKNMRLITAITSIFFPLTLITGWYGMNFANMPELHAKYGYVIIIMISLGVILGEIFYLKRKKKR